MLPILYVSWRQTIYMCVKLQYLLTIAISKSPTTHQNPPANVSTHKPTNILHNSRYSSGNIPSISTNNFIAWIAGRGVWMWCHISRQVVVKRPTHRFVVVVFRIYTITWEHWSKDNKMIESFLELVYFVRGVQFTEIILLILRNNWYVNRIIVTCKPYHSATTIMLCIMYVCKYLLRYSKLYFILYASCRHHNSNQIYGLRIQRNSQLIK